MPVSVQSQIGGAPQSQSALEEKIKNGLHVAMPGVIQSFDPERVTAVIQPAVKGYETDAHGKKQSVTMPLLVDVPVVFPRGGGCTLTFPVRKGDECLLIFSDKCIDFWWQSGDVQEPVSGRSHHIGDAFAIIGPMSQRYKIGGISTTAAQLRTDSGAAFIEIAQGGAVTITSPQVTINGPVQVNGTITSTGDQTAGGISQINHTHGGVQPGGGNTGKPN
ncbi:hypothetical protein TUM12370_18100 [Salmonella enterica subsp. enterica serovar Choleraesuis]|nr:hypothetical protein TUM12370_18100 [Salmonella enterica subsp. enterica serovar Choleraesuis]